MPAQSHPADADPYGPLNPTDRSRMPRTVRPRGGGPASRRIGRRAFFALAASGLVFAGCQPKEEIVYVDAAVPTPTPLPTAPPAPAQGRGPIALQPPAPIVPVAGVSAQAQVIPALQMRNRPYT